MARFDNGASGVYGQFHVDTMVSCLRSWKAHTHGVDGVEIIALK